MFFFLVFAVFLCCSNLSNVKSTCICYSSACEWTCNEMLYANITLIIHWFCTAWTSTAWAQMNLKSVIPTWNLCKFAASLHYSIKVTFYYYSFSGSAGWRSLQHYAWLAGVFWGIFCMQWIHTDEVSMASINRLTWPCEPGKPCPRGVDSKNQ